MLEAGQVKIKRVDPNNWHNYSTPAEVVASGFWRCRGMALGHDVQHGGNYVLYVANEANAWDQPNSGAVQKISWSGHPDKPGFPPCMPNCAATPAKLEVVEQGLDYPQFPVVADGRVFVPLALQNRLAMLDESTNWMRSEMSDPAKGVVVSTTGGSWSPLATTGTSSDASGATAAAAAGAATTLTLSIGSSSFIGAGALAGTVAAKDSLATWVRVPAALIDVYQGELPYNDASHPGPGRVVLPDASCEVTGGGGGSGDCAVSVVALHEHEHARWPMLEYNGTAFGGWTGRLFPNEKFKQQPTDYMLNLRT